jgi:ankyrin repeat protein
MREFLPPAFYLQIFQPVPKKWMLTMKNNYMHVWIAFAVAMLGSATSYARSMRASDYFEAQSQIALAEAAAKGNTDEIGQLLAEGVGVNAQGKEGMTALIWAILHQNKEGFQYLLEHGANPNLQMTESTLTDDGVTDGNSAMSFAAMHEDIWYLTQVLKHGGNPNLVNTVNGLTPIFEDIMRSTRSSSRLMHVRMLIAAGANLNFQDEEDGDTPVMRAAKLNRYDMAYALLEAGADPKIKNQSGYTMLRPIQRNNTDPESEQYQWRAKVIDLLKAKGIDVEHGK